jgi:hypothetical protein
MAKTTRLSKKHYKALMLQLGRDGYAKPGVLARLLLEGFVFENGVFSAERFYSEEVIPEKTFKAFRSKLQADGYWQYSESSASRKQYYPTKRLMSFINSARDNTFASVKYVESRIEPVVEDMNVLKERMHKIEAAVSELQKALEPPVDDQKIVVAQNAARKLAQLAKN